MKIPGGNEYTLTAPRLRRLKRVGKDVCRNCQKPFKIGDRIVSKKGRTHQAQRHKRCWEKSWL